MRLSELEPRGDNPRRITAERKTKLKRSLDELGNLQPLTYNVRTKKLLGGHQRRELLLENGETETDVWCVDLPKEKEKAAMLALNTSSGEWDDEKLGAFLQDLQASGFDAEFFDLAAALEHKETTIVQIKIQPPPKMAWALVGIPIIQFAAVQKILDQMPAEAIIKTTANDDLGLEEDGQS